MLMTRVPLAAPFFLVVLAMLMLLAVLCVGLPFFRYLGAATRMDMSEVERGGLGEIAHVELDEDPVRGVLEGSGAAHPGVVLGMQSELYISALVMSSVVLMAAFLALGAATGAPDHQEGSRECHEAEQEYQYPRHPLEDTIGGGRYSLLTDYVGACFAELRRMPRMRTSPLRSSQKFAAQKKGRGDDAPGPPSSSCPYPPR